MPGKRQDEPLDTYLLRVFTLLVTERSVSRVAVRLQQSQPAISVALRRLREIFGDPLLLREKGGMVPTERALALLAHAKSALAEIDGMIQPPGAFEPNESTITFRIGAPDYLAPAFMASVVERVRRDAPNVRLMVHALGPAFDFEHSLAEGALDVVIGNWPEPPQHMHLSMLIEDQIVCLVNSRHPCARKGSMGAEEYAKAVHVVPMPYSVSKRGMVDLTLASLRIERREAVTVQSFGYAPYLVQHTDMVFTTSRHFANFYADLLGLTILESPIAFPPMRFYQLWHERHHKSPAHQWIRRVLTDTGRLATEGALRPTTQPRAVSGPAPPPGTSSGSAPVLSR
jgi:DNA-binding transcriptional LysR family regulator